MKNNKKWSIIFWLLLIYASAAGNYESSDVLSIKENSYLLAFADLLVISISMMLIPIVLRLKNGKKFQYKVGKKICYWNSFILFVISMILQGALGIGITGAIGALVYYYINKWLFVSDIDANADAKEKKSHEEHIKQNAEEHVEFKCSNCLSTVEASSKYCPNCHESFDEEEANGGSLNEKKYKDLINLKELLEKKL